MARNKARAPAEVAADYAAAPGKNASGVLAGRVDVALPTNAADVATLQREAEENLALVRTAITDLATPEACADADALLTEIVTKKDAVIAMRRTATVPLYGVIKTVESWFAPVVQALEASERHLKERIRAFTLAQAELERAAREAAHAAAVSGDAPALLDALTVAAASAEKPAGVRAAISLTWVVDRVTLALLPEEYTMPDMSKINAVAKAAKGDEPPVIPGVIFRRSASVGAKR